MQISFHKTNCFVGGVFHLGQVMAQLLDVRPYKQAFMGQVIYRSARCGLKLVSNLLTYEFFYLDADCHEVYEAGLPLPGVYTIYPNEFTSVEVYCIEEGWTVIQSRGQFGNPQDYFERLWDDYVVGFGQPGMSFRVNILSQNDKPYI